MLIKMAEHFRRPELWNWKYYRGVVVANSDPTKIKRVKVTIEGIFPAGNNALLPWVGALTDSPKSVNVPEVGDEVCVIFPFDDVYHPFYLGYWNTGTTGNAYLQDDYPNTFGFVYSNLKARFNKSTKIGEIVHSTGSKITVDATGNLVLTGANDITVTCSGKLIMSGTGGTTVGSASSQTIVNGQIVMLGGEGGNPVALVGVSMVSGTGNQGAPVISQILTGASKVMAQ